jgi:hypothetical protein
MEVRTTTTEPRHVISIKKKLIQGNVNNIKKNKIAFQHAFPFISIKKAICPYNSKDSILSSQRQHNGTVAHAASGAHQPQPWFPALKGTVHTIHTTSSLFLLHIRSEVSSMPSAMKAIKQA